ncbi:MAG TPA: dihydrofolate reductase family protein [Nocardioides sp.]|nr:dihydrofolate reductase family protein [Nocardioides sp.]
MRRIVVFTLSTLDGAVDDPNRYFPDPEATGPSAPAYDEVMGRLEAELIARQDAVLLGRGMYDEWSRYWPTSDEQPFADFINSVHKYVLSSRELSPSAWANTEQVSGPLHEVVADLRSRPGDGDIGVHGSITLAQSLLAAGLADELQLVLAPVVDPLGRRLFSSMSELHRLQLDRCTQTDSGALWLVLRPAG